MKSNLHTHFKCLKDPRINRKKLHSLQDIISLVVIGIICGADSWDAIEEFGKAKKDFLSTFLTLQNGIPSHDTINRVFSSINPKKFELAFISWVNSLKNKEISDKSNSEFTNKEIWTEDDASVIVPAKNYNLRLSKGSINHKSKFPSGTM